MRSFPLVPPILLAFLLTVHVRAATRDSDVEKTCCFQYSHKMLPWNWVQAYQFTQISCPQQGVIFTTKKGERVCVQPKEKWVQRYISLLKTKK
ncbi:C-C motif chemokine 26 [Sciurus carolinensis]|uniref:C-C motif chemokine 26 n=1 Tax=Sciurus carolinensis TaxID=30640 RepID=UPI001FB54B64|nr:C-C motif chemokine 26 [Sciurus carolinensis]